jgi:hypothetical protein
MWTSEEFEIVWYHASHRLRQALAVAYYAGMRVGNIVTLPASAWHGET